MVVSRHGEQEVYEADVVVVSAGASNTAKLLLMSANDRHPNGLANGSDQVGRNYMFHNSKAVVALAKELGLADCPADLAPGSDASQVADRASGDRDRDAVPASRGGPRQ